MPYGMPYIFGGFVVTGKWAFAPSVILWARALRALDFWKQAGKSGHGHARAHHYIAATMKNYDLDRPHHHVKLRIMASTVHKKGEK